MEEFSNLYQDLNKLEIYKKAYEDIKCLNISDGRYSFDKYILIHINIFSQLNEKEKFKEEVKEMLLPVFENKIKELQKKVKNQNVK